MERDPMDHPEPFFRRRVGAGVQPRELALGEKIASAFNLHDAALTLIAERIIRENPSATAADVLAAQVTWLSAADDLPAPWFRRRQR
jgi:hypothetical protein